MNHMDNGQLSEEAEALLAYLDDLLAESEERCVWNEMLTDYGGES